MVSATLLLWVVAAQAVGVPELSLSRLTNDSDVVVVGQVVSVETGQTIVTWRDKQLPGRAYQTTVTVLRVIKGSAPSQFSLQYGIPLQRLGMRQVENGTRLLFLKRELNDTFAITSLYYASLPALESVASQKYSSPLDAVISEVGAVLTSSQSATDDKYRAAWAGASEERFTPYLKEGVDSIADPQLRATLIALLIGRGDISHVDEYPKLLTDFTAQGALRSNLLAAIRAMKHPATIPVISTLLKSSDVEVRRQAVQALQDNQSPKADLLLKASLQDSDLQVQLNAIHGLAKRHNVPGVTLGLQEFSDHHETYIRNFSKMSVSQTTNR